MGEIVAAPMANPPAPSQPTKREDLKLWSPINHRHQVVDLGHTFCESRRSDERQPIQDCITAVAAKDLLDFINQPD